MNIYINNKLQQIKEPSNLNEALHEINIISQKGIAIAINNIVIPKQEWISFLLNENDKVTIIKATQGG